MCPRGGPSSRFAEDGANFAPAAHIPVAGVRPLFHKVDRHGNAILDDRIDIVRVVVEDVWQKNCGSLQLSEGGGTGLAVNHLRTTGGVWCS